MASFLDNSLPIRITLLKASELFFTLLALPLTYKLQANGVFTSMTGTDALVSLIGLSVFLCLYLIGFYEPAITVRPIQGLSCIMQASGLTLIVIGSVLEAGVPALRNSPTVLTGMLLIVGGLTVSRLVYARVSQHPAFTQAAIVWGSGRLAATIIRELRKRTDLGIQVIGMIDYDFCGERLAGTPYIGTLEALWGLAEARQVQRLVIALEDRRGNLPLERLVSAKAAGLVVEDAAELYEELTGKVWLGTFSEEALLFSHSFRPSRRNTFIMGALSRLFAIAALIAAAPVMLILALLIRCESRGPVLFRQTRIGKNGRPFTMLKFRSMKIESTGCSPPTVDDPRFTRVGKWIRRFRLDELPQLINILKGEMYLIGPRPFVPEQEESLVRAIPFYRQRWAVCPGATGWAQVHRDYCSSLEDNIEKLAYDLFYIKHISLSLDLLVFFKTVRVVLLGRGGR